MTVKANNPLINVESYRRLLLAQIAFHSQLSPLYQDPIIGQMALGLPDCGRASQLSGKLFDSQVTSVFESNGAVKLPGGFIQRLGWLYVGERVYRSAAILLSAAQRHMTDNPTKSIPLYRNAKSINKTWRDFSAKLSRLSMSEVEAERFYSGARSALASAEKTLCDVCGLTIKISGFNSQ